MVAAVLLRFCPCSEPRQNRCQTDAKSMQHGGKHGVDNKYNTCGFYLVSTSVLPRAQNRCKPRGRQKVQHMGVLPLIYLGLAAVLHCVCPVRNLSGTEATPKQNHGEGVRTCVFYLLSTSCLPLFCFGSAPFRNRSRTEAKPRQKRGRQNVVTTCVIEN